MDHIPIPPDSWLVQTKIPLVARERYDSNGFDSFAHRSGFIVDDQIDVRRGADAICSILQAWLFFGLLTELLGSHFTSQEYVIADKEVCTKRLLTDLDSWQQHLRKLERNDVDRELAQMKRTIKTAIDASVLFDSLHYFTKPTSFAPVLLSVKLLIASLVHIHNVVSPAQGFSIRQDGLIPLQARLSEQSILDAHFSPAAKLLIAQMLSSGWCKSSVRRICLSYDYLTVFYMAHLTRTRNGDHDSCTQSACYKYHVDEETYVTKHITSDCQCQHVFVDIDKVKSIIKNGDIPLVEFSSSASGETVMTVTRFALHAKEITQMSFGRGLSALTDIIYYAISHVWADGLGNSHANSLPTCRIHHLHSLFKRKRVLLWIDTLCIPVGEDAIRSKAILSMHDIYQRASEVIVCDDEIEQLCKPLKTSWAGFYSYIEPMQGTDLMTSIHIRSMILCSAWNSRRWTYQEAVLGHTFRFCTKDGLSLALTKVSVLAPRIESINHLASHRWASWHDRRGFSATMMSGVPNRYLIGSMSGLYLLAYCVFCGPQASRLCLRAILDDGKHFSRLFQLLFGIVWLVLALLAGLATIPLCICMVGIASVIYLIVSLVEYAARIRASRLLPTTSDSLHMEIALQLGRYISKELHVYRLDGFHEMTFPEKTRELRSSHFAKTWNALTWRSTSKEGDKQLIFATLCSISVELLMALPNPARRIRAIVAMHEELWIDLLFDRTNARDPQNSWLPLAPDFDRIEESGKAHVTADRIHFKLSDFDGRLLLVRCMQKRSRGNIEFFHQPSGISLALKQMDEGLEDDDKHGEDVHGEDDLIGQHLYLLELPRHSSLARGTTTCRGARLTMISQQSQQLYCKYDKPVRWCTISESQPRLAVQMLPVDTTICLPFVHETSDRIPTRTSLILCAGPALFLLFGFLLEYNIMLIILGDRLGWNILYTGYPVGCLTFLSSFYPIWIVYKYAWVERQEDEQLDSSLESYAVYGLRKWLLCCCRNLIDHPSPVQDIWFSGPVEFRTGETNAEYTELPS